MRAGREPRRRTPGPPREPARSDGNELLPHSLGCRRPPLPDVARAGQRQRFLLHEEREHGGRASSVGGGESTASSAAHPARRYGAPSRSPPAGRHFAAPGGAPAALQAISAGAQRGLDWWYNGGHDGPRRTPGPAVIGIGVLCQEAECVWYTQTCQQNASQPIAKERQSVAARRAPVEPRLWCLRPDRSPLFGRQDPLIMAGGATWRMLPSMGPGCGSRWLRVCVAAALRPQRIRRRNCERGLVSAGRYQYWLLGVPLALAASAFWIDPRVAPTCC